MSLMMQGHLLHNFTLMLRWARIPSETLQQHSTRLRGPFADPVVWQIVKRCDFPSSFMCGSHNPIERRRHWLIAPIACVAIVISSLANVPDHHVQCAIMDSVSDFEPLRNAKDPRPRVLIFPRTLLCSRWTRFDGVHPGPNGTNAELTSLTSSSNQRSLLSRRPVTWQETCAKSHNSGPLKPTACVSSQNLPLQAECFIIWTGNGSCGVLQRGSVSNNLAYKHSQAVPTKVRPHQPLHCDSRSVSYICGIWQSLCFQLSADRRPLTCTIWRDGILCWFTWQSTIHV